MAENGLESLLSTSMQGLRDMVDVNTIIGEPIETKDGTTIIPISKVSFGFGMGGFEQDTMQKHNVVSGGSGGGVSIQPVGFLVINDGSVKMLNIDSSTTMDKVLDTLPDLIKSVSSLFGKNKD